MAPPGNSNSASAIPVGFETTPDGKTIRLMKPFLAGSGGATLLTLLTCAAQAHPVPASAIQPFYFEANREQADSPAPFLARGRDFRFLVSPGEAQISLAIRSAWAGQRRGRCGCNSSGPTDARQFPASRRCRAKSIISSAPTPRSGRPAFRHSRGLSGFAQGRESSLVEG